MKALAAIGIGVAWLWLFAPTYDQLQHPLPEIVALTVGLALIVGGLFALLRRAPQ